MRQHVTNRNVSTNKIESLPDSLRDATVSDRGLVLICGTTGSGKSHTIASLVNEVNETKESRITTIGYINEFFFEDKKSHIHQNVVSLNESFTETLRQERQNGSDIFMIDEIRDSETAQEVLKTASDSLTFATLCAQDAAHALVRLNSITESDLSNINCIITQRLTLCASCDCDPENGSASCTECNPDGFVIEREITIITDSLKEAISADMSVDDIRTLLNA